MPTLQRPDGTEIAWRERGQGPPILLANLGYAPEVLWTDLIEQLARDHRVITYDSRGCGGSSRTGPYEIETDAGDLLGVIEAAQAEGAVVIGNGDGANRSVRAAARLPELIQAVLLPGAIALPVARSGREGLSSSGSVLKGLITLLENDYRAGVSSFVSSGNPGLDEAVVHERVELIVAHGSHEATLARIRSWIAHDATDDARAIGDRLWILHHDANPWFSKTPQFEQLLPEAHHEEVEDGPMERPDLTAAAARRITRIAAR